MKLTRSLNPHQLVVADGQCHLLEFFADYASQSEGVSASAQRSCEQSTREVLGRLQRTSRRVLAARPLYYHHLGYVHSRRGDSKAAWSSYEKSLRWTRVTKIPFIEARSRLGLSRCTQFSGRKRLEHLQLALKIFHEGGFDHWEAEANRQMEELKRSL